jgi:hypothetical protein
MVNTSNNNIQKLFPINKNPKQTQYIFSFKEKSTLHLFTNQIKTNDF